MIIDHSSNIAESNLSIKDCIKLLDKLELKILFIVNSTKTLIGTLTDGDIRRVILKGNDLSEPISIAMNKNYVKYTEEEDLSDIENKILKDDLQAIPIVNKDGMIIEVHAAGAHLNQSYKENTVLLMAGGFGTRLTPLTDDCPKPLLKVGEKPIIQTIIENFIEYGLHKFVISTHYKSEMIQEYLGTGKNLGCSIEYLEEKSPLGTAGCLSLLSDNHLKKPIFIMNADILTKVNFNQLLDFHLKAKSLITMCVRNYMHQIPYGVIRTNEHHIESIDEKPTQVAKVNAGIYLVNPEIVANLEKGKYLDMPSLINNELEKNHSAVSVFPIHEYWLDIGQIEDYQKAQVDFISNFSNE
tara:strand:+ start:335 stop:1399 length:1065 start_codon:yes stop_codon:yes gene_type:complete